MTTPPEATLALIKREAASCGMTRLAEVTRLDSIGIPTWQAIRPMSRSLSVHQGKGFDPVSAQIGACMEAIECAFGEAWDGPRHLARHADLPAHERSAAADDFADRRGAADIAIDWTPAERIGGGRLWVPWWSVSLDFAQPLPQGIDITSTGQGAGLDSDRASCKGLLEVIERDAWSEWLRCDLFARSQCEIDPATVPFSWFQDLHARLTSQGMALRLFALPAVIAIPVIVAELIDTGESAAHRPATGGVCCDWGREAALAGAIAETAQSRLAFISGSRDDLDLGGPAVAPPSPGYALALGRPRRNFSDIVAPADPPADFADGFATAVAALAAAGYDQVARLFIQPPASPVIVARLMVPGLASADRCRRPGQ